MMSAHRDDMIQLPRLESGRDLKGSRLWLWNELHHQMTIVKSGSAAARSRSLDDDSIAMSCTLNMSNLTTRKKFDSSFITKATGAYNFKSPGYPSNCKLEILTALKDHGIHGARQAICKLRLENDSQTDDNLRRSVFNILDALDRVCRLVERPSYGEGASEADHVQEWKGVFNDILKGSTVYMRSGECISEASKAIRMVNRGQKTPRNFGRKVDLNFYDIVANDELAIFEFKDAWVNRDREQLLEQLSKSIRLNRSIMEYSHYSKRGIRPTILFMTFKGDVYALYQFGDIFVSKLVKQVILPHDQGSLEKFLTEKDEALGIILGVEDHLKNIVSELCDEPGPLKVECRDIDTAVCLTPQGF